MKESIFYQIVINPTKDRCSKKVNIIGSQKRNLALIKLLTQLLQLASWFNAMVERKDVKNSFNLSKISMAKVTINLI